MLFETVFNRHRWICSSPDDTREFPNPACSDTIDNDNDGDIDFPDDAECTDATDNREHV